MAGNALPASFLLANRRATMIVNQVRLFLLCLPMLTRCGSWWIFWIFASPLWWQLALMRVLASAAFASRCCLPIRGNLLDTYQTGGFPDSSLCFM